MTGICFCRSDFSIGESMLKVTQIAKIAKEKNYSAVALCDTMTLSSLIEASQACAKENIPLISGVRLRIVEDATVKDKKQNNRAWFPKLYFKNEEGLRIAYKLLTMSFADDNFYYVPRLSFEHLLNEITTDVIISLGDQHSQVGTRLLDERVQMLVNKIGAENIVAECIPFNTPIFDRLTKESLCIAKKYGLKLMYSDLCMYSEPKNKKALIALSAIASKGESVTFNTPWLNKPVYDTAYIKDYTDYIQMCKDQMNRIKSRYNIDVTPLVEAVKFSAFGFEKLFSYKWEAKSPCLPQMDKKPFDKLKELCKEGFKNKLTKPILGYMPDPTELPKYAARLQYELDIIEKLDFSNYFLLVKDILDWARQNGMGGSYGRGSSGGCLIAFLLDIVETDPIRFGLMFERFINPSRHDLPDVDMDISSSKRQELIARIIQDYGSENVASISNYITLGASGVIRACGRVYGLPINEYSCSSKVPSEHGVSYSLSQAVAVVPEIELFATKYPEVWETALQLEGCISAYGVHAAGLIVAGEPLINRAVVENRRGNQVVCWDKLVVESMGLIKMDLLGLTTLDVLNLAKQYVKDNFNVDLDLLSIPLDDKETLKLFGEGKTSGVFQFEVAGALLKRLAVNEPLRFEDLVAATALNRPGPMDSGLLEDYVAIKQGLKDEHYDHPNLKEALKETYGVIVYQEQVMKASMDLAGFTASEADFLRKCIVGDSVVALDDDFVTIEDLYRNKEKYIGKNIFSLNEKYKTVKDKIIDVYDNGYADVYKIKTKLGCELECTADHKLLKIDGFTELKNLNVGDSIAINFSNPQQKLNRNRVKKFNLAFNSQKIDDFINCDVIWDDIESIEFVGKKHVYDLQTNNNHNYLANNIVVHNCMGKKDLKKMQTYKQQWIEGCQKISNMHPFDAEALWNKIEAFAGYAFNKSHSVEYTLLSFASMYIKAHYPTAFYAATLSVLPEEKLKNIVKDADSNGIKVLPPDINLAGENFTIIDDKTIMIPFNRVKGVGPTAVKAILDARADGSFTSYQDFEARVTGKCNKRHRESLNKIGAFANIVPGQQPSSDITRLKDQYELLPELVIKTLKSTKRISGTDVKKALDKNNEMGQSLMEPLGKKYVHPYSGKVIRYVVIFDGPNKSDLSSGKFANVRQFEAISTALNVAGITKEEGYWTGLMKTSKEQKEITTPELALNLPLLQRELQLLKPEIIVLMGPDVIRQFAKDVKKPSEAIGQSFYDAEYDATFIIGMNPGMIYFRPEKQKDLNSVFEKVATMIH